jgi:hypothetical protein
MVITLECHSDSLPISIPELPLHLRSKIPQCWNFKKRREQAGAAPSRKPDCCRGRPRPPHTIVVALPVCPTSFGHHDRVRPAHHWRTTACAPARHGRCSLLARARSRPLCWRLVTCTCLSCTGPRGRPQALARHGRCSPRVPARSRPLARIYVAQAHERGHELSLATALLAARTRTMLVLFVAVARRCMGVPDDTVVLPCRRRRKQERCC